VKYPATLVTTADHDDAWCPRTASSSPRVAGGPGAAPNPVLIRIESKAGHGAGKPTTKMIEEAADRSRRTGRDTDVWVMNPAEPKSDRLLCELSGGGWGVSDWSADETKLLLQEYISINQSRLYLADAKTGAKELLTPDEATPVARMATRSSPRTANPFSSPRTRIRSSSDWCGWICVQENAPC
jgi:hypothetical protein